MDVADQVLAYLRVLTWPVTVSLAIVLFRGSIRGLLGGVEEFEGFGVKAKIRQRVTDGTTAAEQALDGSPIGQAPMNQQRVAPHLITVIPRVEEALTVSTRLAGEMPGPPDDPLREMRSVLNWLDTAITAVLVVMATSESPERKTEAWTDMTPAGVDRHLADLTGVSGWRGVIESRNILRSTLIVVCGLGGKTTGQAEAAEFARVALRALQRWQDLVNRVAGSAHRFAQDL